jgi:hypothetical protein
MNKSISEKRMMENQVVFRKLNERVQKGIDEVNQIASEDGLEPIDIDGDEPLFFYCECSDENCRNRIKLSPNEYNDIHRKKDTFTILPGHQVPQIEDVIEETPDYIVVRKHVMPNQDANVLKPTEVENV